MEKYLEFQNLKLIEDKKNSFCRLYEYEDGSRFYIEPIFYALLENFKVQYSQEFDIVLKKMEELKDGFEVSNYDLHMRGPGDILGIRQSGMPCLVFGDFEKDQAMMEMCIQDAKEIIQDQVDVDLLLYISNAIENAQYFD